MPREKLREFALEYDINMVAEKYMAGVIEELCGELAGQRRILEEGDAKVEAGT